MRPPLTEERQARITSAIDTLNESRLWHERVSKGELTRERAEVMTSALAFVASVISLILSMTTRQGTELQGDGWFSASLILSIMFLALTVALVYAAMMRYYMNVHEPALFYDGERLFLLMPKNADVERDSVADVMFRADEREEFWESGGFDRYDMLAIRENLHGNLSGMISQDIHDTLRASELSEAYALGNDTHGWDVEEIGDIDSVISDPKSGQTTFAYCDGNGDEHELQLDTYGWNGFLSWLDEQNPDTPERD